MDPTRILVILSVSHFAYYLNVVLQVSTDDRVHIWRFALSEVLVFVGRHFVVAESDVVNISYWASV